MEQQVFLSVTCGHPTLNMRHSLEAPEYLFECKECGRKVAITLGTLLSIDMETQFKLVGMIFGAPWEKAMRDNWAREQQQLWSTP